MRFAHVLILTVSVTSYASTVASESLGEAAARQKKRREEQKDAAADAKKPPRKFDDESLQEYEKTRPLSDAVDAGSAPGPTEAAPPSRGSSSKPQPSAAPASPGGDSAKREAADMFRKQLQDCGGKLASAQAALKAVQDSDVVVVRCPDCKEGDRIDMDRRTAGTIRSEQLARAQADVSRIQGECDAIESEARRSGIPPGWIR